MTPARLVWLATVAFAAGFSALAVLRHRAFESGRFDLGNMTQAVWSTANGDMLSVTDVHGEQISRLGSHFDPILALLAPLWWLWPSPELLLVVQAVAVAAGAIPLFWLARRHLPDWPAAAIACAYLLFPPVQWLTASDFHPVALAMPAAALRLVLPRRRPALPFALCAAAAIATKEHVGLAVAAMGVWYASATARRGRGRRRRRRRIGRAPRGARRRAALRARGLGVREPLRRPVARQTRPRLPRALLLPLALLPLAAPLTLLAALPEMFLNLLSTTTTQTSVRTHYAATAFPPSSWRGFRGARLGPSTAYLVALAAASVGMSSSARSGGSRSAPTRTTQRCASGGGRSRRRGGERDERSRRPPVGTRDALQLPDPARR